MRAVVDRKDFDTMLKWHAAGSSLRLLYARVEGDSLVIESASEIEWKRTVIPTSACEPGEVRFSSARIVEQMKTARNAQTVELKVEKNNLLVKVGRSTSMSPIVAEIPGWWGPKNEPTEVAEADLESLRWCFKAASHACARPGDVAAEILKGVKVIITEGEITMHATDTYRLASAQVECMSSAEVQFLTSPSHFTASLAMMDDPVTIVADDGHYGASGNQHTFILRSFAGELRDVSGVLKKAKGYADGAAAGTLDLAAAINGVGAGRGGQVNIDFHDDYLSITNAISMDGMAGTTDVEVEAEVDEALRGHSIRVNVNNLAEMLKAIRTKNVSISTNDTPRAPLILREHMDENEQKSYAGTDYLGFVALVAR